MNKKRKVIWPIHPTDSDLRIDENIVDCLTQLKRQFDFTIQPVSVMSADFFSTSEYFEPVDTQALREHLLQDCQNYIGRFKDFEFEDIVILENHYASQSGEVAMFANFVDQAKPDFVIMSSHGRKGWSRAFMGSFAESFLVKSTVPVLVVGPKYTKGNNFQSALMPVELSEKSQEFIETFLDHHALEFLNNLTLFHKVSMVDLEDIAWAPTLYGVGGVGADDVVKRAYEKTKKFLESFLIHPLSEKRLSYEISKRIDPLSEVIVERVKENDIGILVMRSEAGVLSANILGSITREVMRDSSVPVLVYPHACKKI